MKMRDMAEVTLGILGVYSVVGAACLFPNLIFNYFWSPKNESGRVLYNGHSPATDLVTFAVTLAGGIALLRLARPIADWLLRKDAALASREMELKILSPAGFRFCLKLVGVYALFKAVETVVSGAARANFDPGDLNAWFSFSFLRPLAPGVFILALAIYLLRGGGWLTRFAWPE